MPANTCKAVLAGWAAWTLCIVHINIVGGCRVGARGRHMRYTSLMARAWLWPCTILMSPSEALQRPALSLHLSASSECCLP